MIEALVVLTTMLENLTTNPAQAIFSPYIALLGDFFYGFLAMGVALVIYSNTEGNAKTIGVAVWLVMFLGVCISILNAGVVLAVGMGAAILVGAIIRRGFAAKEED